MSRPIYRSSDHINQMGLTGHGNGHSRHFNDRPVSYAHTGLESPTEESLNGGAAVARSRSFTGGLNKQSHGPTRPISGRTVLGESVKSPGIQKKSIYGSQTNLGFSFKKMPKMPKVPRPQRAGLIFDALRRGLRECIDATEEDVRLLHSRTEEASFSKTAQAKMYELEKQLKSAERYKKRLEFHLTKIEEMCDCYILQHQLREGTRNMAKAYIASPNSKKTLHKVKDGYKECTQNMCAIEAQLENMMGTFHCRMKGMVGFARLIPGDVFEISIRHGEQKWKTKGRISKNSLQKWDQPVMVFKALLANVFTIKAVEARKLGRNISMGEKHCETKDLFSGSPQMMTVNVNTAGSLKLSVIVTWNPLEGIDDKLMYYDPTPHLEKGRFHSTLALTQPHSQSMMDLSTSSSSAYSPTSSMYGSDAMSKRRLGNGHPVPFDGRPRSAIYLPDTRSSSGSGSRSPSLYSHRYSLPPTQEEPSNTHYDVQRTNSTSTHSSYDQGSRYSRNSRSHSIGSDECTMNFDANTLESSVKASRRSSSDYSQSKETKVHKNTESELTNASLSTTAGMSKQRLHDMRLLTESLSGDSSQGERKASGTLEDAVNSIKSTLADYRGQYREVDLLEQQIAVLVEMSRKNNHGRVSRSSSISVSIESALEAFDFLQDEGEDSDHESPHHSPIVLSPESTAKTSDSGIESLATRLSEDNTSLYGLGTGNEQADLCLIHHLTYCERLLQNLGCYGPLKCKEIYALDKIEKQATIMEKLLHIARDGSQVNNIEIVLQGLTGNKRLREFWVKCVDQTSLFVNCERFLAQLERSYGERIRDKYDIVASKVFRKVIARILDIPTFEAETVKTTTIVTLHQFMSFFADEGMKTVTEYVEQVAKQIWTSTRLRSGDSDMVVKTIFTFRDSLPHMDCLKVLALLLISNNRDIKHTAASYLRGLNVSPDLRKKALVVYVEALEDRNADIRCGACVALAALKARESIDQLVFVCQSDSSHVVKASAKEALFSFGAEGRRAFEDGIMPAGGGGLQAFSLHQ